MQAEAPFRGSYLVFQAAKISRWHRTYPGRGAGTSNRKAEFHLLLPRSRARSNVGADVRVVIVGIDSSREEGEVSTVAARALVRHQAYIVSLLKALGGHHTRSTSNGSLMLQVADFASSLDAAFPMRVATSSAGEYTKALPRFLSDNSF